MRACAKMIDLHKQVSSSSCFIGVLRMRDLAHALILNTPLLRMRDLAHALILNTPLKQLLLNDRLHTSVTHTSASTHFTLNYHFSARSHP
jgi:hypothetical protein